MNCLKTMKIFKKIIMIREIIKQAMMEQNVKSVELAKYIGVTRSSFSLFLSGEINLMLPKLEMIFEYLNIQLVIKR